MKKEKFLKLLYVSIFAPMTFTFTACGDDDDEPDGGSNNKGVVGELTIDGTKTSFYYIQGITKPIYINLIMTRYYGRKMAKI